MNLAKSNISNFDVDKIRSDFPVLSREVYNKPLVFLDSAASSQKPSCVIDEMKKCYEEEYANIHRGVYWLSMQSTKKFENARKTVKKFINAESWKEIIFVRGGTEAINLVTHSYGRAFLKAGDEVIISHLEHHANIVPWQVLRDELGIVIKVAPIDKNGNFLLDEYKKLLNEKTKIVAITHVSNALGTVTPIKEIIRLAHEAGAKTLVDGCQSVPHMQIDVQDLDADFFVFSGHKVYAPSGIGVLYGKAELLNAMPPYQTGGEMILTVTHEKTTYNEIPTKFEAGTPAIVQAIGLGVALEYLMGIGMDNIHARELELFEYAYNELSKVDGITIYSNADEKAGAISFNIDGIHPHDVGTIFDQEGVAVRAGHHCAQPIMQFLGVPATVRASFGIYNDFSDVDALVVAIGKAKEIFG